MGREDRPPPSNKLISYFIVSILALIFGITFEREED